MATIRPQRNTIERLVRRKGNLRLKRCARFPRKKVRFLLWGNRKLHLLGFSRSSGLAGANEKVVAVFGFRPQCPKVSNEDWNNLSAIDSAVLFLSKVGQKKGVQGVQLLRQMGELVEGETLTFRFRRQGEVESYPSLITA